MKIAIEPANWRQAALQSAIREAGAEIVPIEQASALIWVDTQAGDLQSLLHDRIDWVQLPWAGIEPFLEVLDHKRRWTCGKGIYAEPVAEHVLAMILACYHRLPSCARAKQWTAPGGQNLRQAQVLILGGGGITQSLLPLLQPFDCKCTVLRRKAEPLPGATRTVGFEALHEELPKADVVVLALALTKQTTGLIGARELNSMKPTACIVNVARGAHIRTDDLVEALRNDRIGSAALDVTDPEPLPEGHPLWSMPNCLITPHVGNTPEMGIALLCEHVVKNVRRYINGQDLLGPVDVNAGY